MRQPDDFNPTPGKVETLAPGIRRILCNMLGNDIEKGRIPRDFDLVGAMVKEISYTNAANYFGFDVPQV